MTGVAPGDETDRTPTDVPAQASEVAGEAGRPQDEPTGDGLVQIAYCHGSRVSHSWHVSMQNMLVYDKVAGFNVIQSAPYMVSCSGPHGLVEGRNLAVKDFLDRTAHEWLFWVDTDMGFDPNSLDRLLAAADPVERPVVGGLCFALKHTGPDGMGGFNVQPVPTIFGLMKHPEQGIGFVNRHIYPPDALIQVAGTGSAFILIHRSVLEDIRAKMGETWYDLVSYADGKPVSEDLSFCWRVGATERPLFVHTGVRTTHHKELWVGEADYHMPDAEPMYRSTKQAMADA